MSVFTKFASLFKTNSSAPQLSETTLTGTKLKTEKYHFNVYGVAGDQAQQQRLSFYKQVDRLLKDDKASRAAEVFADFIVSANDSAKMEVRVSGNARAKKIIDDTNKRIGLKNLIWEFGNNLVSYGDGFYEVVLHKKSKEVIALTYLAPETMKKVLDERGYYKNYYDKAFVQTKNEGTEEAASFPGYQILHVNAGNRSPYPLLPFKAYGYSRSIFYTALKRFIMHMQADKAAYISRLFYGMQRIIEYVDTGTMERPEAQMHINQQQQAFRNEIVTNKSTGEVDLEAFFDSTFFQKYFVPRSEKLKHSEISLLQTQVSSGIDDIMYFRNEYINALRVPKFLMGDTGDVATRANGLSFSADFAKSCARFQDCITAAIIPFFKNVLALNGIHHSNYEIEIVFPIMGTVDQLMKHQVIALQATIMKSFAVDTRIPMDVVLQDFLNIPETKVKTIMSRIGEYVPPQQNMFGSEDGKSTLSEVQEILSSKIAHDSDIALIAEEITRLGEFYETNR